MAGGTAYALSDLLLFSPRVYYRLFELHNRAVWPAQLLTGALGVAVLSLMLRPMRGRAHLLSAILGLLWLWVAWAFVWQRYATINGRARWLLVPVPLAWCAVSGGTLWTMGAGDFLVAPLGGLSAVGIAAWPRAQPRRPVPR